MVRFSLYWYLILKQYFRQLFLDELPGHELVFDRSSVLELTVYYLIHFRAFLGQI